MPMQTSLSRSEPSFNSGPFATDFSATSQAVFLTVLGVCTALQARLSMGTALELDTFYEEAQGSLERLVHVARRRRRHARS